jgi:hypothetical protein
MEQTKQTTIRFPQDLHDKIKQMALKERRTLNDQVVYLCDMGVAWWENPNPVPSTTGSRQMYADGRLVPPKETVMS